MQEVSVSPANYCWTGRQQGRRCYQHHTSVSSFLLMCSRFTRNTARDDRLIDCRIWRHVTLSWTEKKNLFWTLSCREQFQLHGYIGRIVPWSYILANIRVSWSLIQGYIYTQSLGPFRAYTACSHCLQSWLPLYSFGCQHWSTECMVLWCIHYGRPME